MVLSIIGLTALSALFGRQAVENSDDQRDRRMFVYLVLSWVCLMVDLCFVLAFFKGP